jgi:hypothetical protein
MKGLLISIALLSSFSSYALESCLDGVVSDEGAVIQCDGDVSNVKVKTYYAPNGAQIDDAVVCLYEKSLNIDEQLEKYVPELRYKADVIYNRGDSVEHAKASVRLRDDSRFIYGNGVYKLREAKNDANIPSDSIYKVTLDKENATATIFDGTDSYLTWRGFKYAAYIGFRIGNCHRVR